MIDDVTRELSLDLPVEQAWPTLTDPVLMREWLADEVVIELVPGGAASFVVDGEPRDGWVEEVSPPREDAPGRLVFWWQADGEPASRVVLELVADGDGSRLLVRETRPLELLDLVGRSVGGLGGVGGSASGPVLVAA